MEAANRGAFDVEAKSVGLNISLPQEQYPNPYVTPELCFSFHYFALRKLHFLLRAKALVAFPGGYGTFDELFEMLTWAQLGLHRKPVGVLTTMSDGRGRPTIADFLGDRGQFLLRDLVGREQGALATDQADQGRAGALADPQGGQLGVKAGPFPTAPLARACRRGAVEGTEVRHNFGRLT
jgi:hypothetical protein